MTTQRLRSLALCLWACSALTFAVPVAVGSSRPAGGSVPVAYIASHETTVRVDGITRDPCNDPFASKSACAAPPAPSLAPVALRVHNGVRVRFRLSNPARSLTVTIVDRDFRQVGAPLPVTAGAEDGHRWLSNLPRSIPQGAYAFNFVSERADFEGASDEWLIRISRHRHRAGRR